MCKPLNSTVTITVEAPGKEPITVQQSLDVHWAQRLRPSIHQSLSQSLEVALADLVENAEAEVPEPSFF